MVESTTGARAGEIVGAPQPGRPRVVAVCLVPARRKQAITYLTQALDVGGSALLITADGSTGEGLPAGMEHLDLASSERAVGAHAVLAKSPSRMIGKAFGRTKSGPSTAWRTWSRSRPYRAIRPWVLWRALRPHLSELDVLKVDHVIIASIESWPITWQLQQLNPRITYDFDVPTEVYLRAGREPYTPQEF